MIRAPFILLGTFRGNTCGDAGPAAKRQTYLEASQGKYPPNFVLSGFVKIIQGASAELLLYGATVISWKCADNPDSEPSERLFVSSTAFLDGSKPVRGGIPIVFPCFGAPTHPDHTKLNQHGFARSEVWSFDGIETDNDTAVSVKLCMSM